MVFIYIGQYQILDLSALYLILCLISVCYLLVSRLSLSLSNLIILYNSTCDIIFLISMVIKVDDIILGMAMMALVASQYYFLRKASEMDKRRTLAHLFRTCTKCKKDFCCMDYRKCEDCIRCDN